MSHERAPDAAPTAADTGGVEWEKWILRVLLLGVLGVATAAVVGSLDDIKRYVHIRQM